MKKVSVLVIMLMLIYAGACKKRNTATQTGIATQSATGNCDTQSGFCNDYQTITTSGTTIAIPSNGGMVPTFDEVVTGAPATVSIVIQGCGASGTTCESLDTNTTVGTAIRAPSITKSYSKYLVTATWSGGTNVAVAIKTQISTAARPPGVPGNTAGTNTWTGANTFTQPVTLAGANLSANAIFANGTGVQYPHWVTYETGGNYYIRDNTNGVMQLYCIPGAGTAGYCETSGSVIANQLMGGSTQQFQVDQNGNVKMIAGNTLGLDSDTLTNWRLQQSGTGSTATLGVIHSGTMNALNFGGGGDAQFGKTVSLNNSNSLNFDPMFSSEWSMQQNGTGAAATFQIWHQGNANATLNFDANGNMGVASGTNIVLRCTTAGTLPVGALTITAGNCGASTDTGLRVK